MTFSEVSKNERMVDYFPDRIEDPRSYYKGVDLPKRVICRNVIVFERLSRRSLQQKSVANRMHHRYVLVLVLKTAGVISVDGQGFQLDVGDAFLITPYQFHHFIDLECDNLRWLIITFELDEGKSILAELSYNRLRPDQLSHQLWSEIVQLWLASSSRCKAELIPILDRLLTRLHLGRIASRHWGSEKNLLPGNDWIARVEVLIMQSVREGWTMGWVAQRAGISERHLRDRFERQMGISLRDYRSNYQFHTAISLMRDASCSLSAVAELSGFNSQSVFTRFIRRKSGRTPRQLCREIREGRYQWSEPSISEP